ncbi:MAG: GxxExxY protein [bacterium]|nr:GxxExxY protein [bacterium]
MQEKDINSLTEAVIGAAIEVHRELGPGFLEAIYEQALAVELNLRRLEYKRQHPVGVRYKGQVIGEGFLDFLISDCLIVELKAVEEFSSLHTAQVISYLKTTKLRYGLLINFNVKLLKQGLKRVILDQ